MLTDRAIGSIALAVGTVLMLYYTIWMVGMPFVDSEHFSQALFPPKVYGLMIPSALGGTIIVGAVLVGSLHGIWKTGEEDIIPPEDDK